MWSDAVSCALCAKVAVLSLRGVYVSCVSPDSRVQSKLIIWGLGLGINWDGWQRNNQLFVPRGPYNECFDDIDVDIRLHICFLMFESL